jgi:hypothetical protein
MERAHRADHDRLRVMIDDYVALLRPERRSASDAVVRQRLAIAHAFRAHVASEAAVFQRLRTGQADDPVDRLLDDYGASFREFQTGYQAMTRDWTPQRIARAWPDYCRDVRALMRRYFAFLAWEETHVLPLLERLEPDVAQRRQP